jgi:hypothetical protein
MRLWLVVTVLWVIGGGVIARPDLAVSALWTDRVYGRLDLTQLQRGLDEVDVAMDKMKSTRLGVVSAEIEAALSGKPVSESVARYQALEGDAETLHEQIGVARDRERRWDDLGKFAMLVLGPPIAVFLIGTALIWVIAGFRPK